MQNTLPGYAPIPQQGGYIPPGQTGGNTQTVGVGVYTQTVNGNNNALYQPQGYGANQLIPEAGAVPPPSYGGNKYIYVPDPMAELAMSTGVLIRQEAQFLEQITGCESPNRYFVFSQSPQGGMKLLFKCKEQSGCCMRNCCPANSREFNMLIKHVKNASNLDDNYSAPYLHISKPFKCTCCCLDRPEMLAYFCSTHLSLGKIKQPMNCCDPEFYIYDGNVTKRYTIYADCCQCGLFCKNNYVVNYLKFISIFII
jgi:hypothetical protein